MAPKKIKKETKQKTSVFENPITKHALKSSKISTNVLKSKKKKIASPSTYQIKSPKKPVDNFGGITTSSQTILTTKDDLKKKRK